MDKFASTLDRTIGEVPIHPKSPTELNARLQHPDRHAALLKCPRRP